jgi:GcrA cell cycle regulator
MTWQTWRWTEERVALLKKLWGEGHSASICAARINAAFSDSNVSRNAAIAKVHRLGLSGRQTLTRNSGSCVVKSKKRKHSKATGHLWFPRLAASAAVFEADGFTPVVDEIVVPLAERRQLIDLPDNNCRWPIGDPQEPDFHFCNRGKIPGLPYCETHARRAYQPLGERRRSKTVREITDMPAKDTENA